MLSIVTRTFPLTSRLDSAGDTTCRPMPQGPDPASLT